MRQFDSDLGLQRIYPFSDTMHESFVSIKHLSIRCDGRKYLIHNLSFDVSQGDFIVILGANGSGKTSLLKAISGTTRSYTGSIKLFDKFEVKNTSHKKLSQSMAMITQNVSHSLFSEFSLRQNFKIYMDAFENTDIKLEDFSGFLKKFNAKLVKLLDQKISTLSGGEKQVFLLALNIFFRREILMLDEHTSALDPKTAHEVMKITDENIHLDNLTCIMTTHSLDDAIKYGNKLIAMKDGRILKFLNSEEKSNLSKIDLLDCCY